MKKVLSTKEALKTLQGAGILPSLKLIMKYMILDGYLKAYTNGAEVTYRPDRRRVNRLAKADTLYSASSLAEPGGDEDNINFMRSYK